MSSDDGIAPEAARATVAAIGGALLRGLQDPTTLAHLTRSSEGIGDWSSMLGSPAYALQVTVNGDLSAGLRDIAYTADRDRRLALITLRRYAKVWEGANLFSGQLVVTDLGYIRRDLSAGLPVYRARLDVDEQQQSLIKLLEMNEGPTAVRLHYDHDTPHVHGGMDIGRHLGSLVFWPPKASTAETIRRFQDI